MVDLDGRFLEGRKLPDRRYHLFRTIETATLKQAAGIAGKGESQSCRVYGSTGPGLPSGISRLLAAPVSAVLSEVL